MSKSEEGSSPSRQAPINLTAAADGMTWREACNTLRIDSKGQAAHLRIQPLDDDEKGRRNDSSFDIIYVVISGYGLLRYDKEEMECTAGDVLFIPRGNPHQLECMDIPIRIWMIEFSGVYEDTGESAHEQRRAGVLWRSQD